MKRTYLLDTNILSDLVRNPQGRAADRIRDVGDASVCTSIVATAELRFSVEKNRSSRLMRQVEIVLSGIETLPLIAPFDETYARMRAQMERAGAIIGANDMLIAAHALTANLVLVTANEREFARVPKLKIENWLRP